jgi:putative tributyrin esterase
VNSSMHFRHCLSRIASGTSRTRQRTPLCCLVLLVICGSGVCQQTTAGSGAAIRQEETVKDAVFHSVSLQREMRYRIIVPRDYDEGGRFPILYLLHGLYGDYRNWDTKTSLENYARNVHVLIVMPDADDSWYTNSATVTGDKFEDYVAKDLIREIDEKYRTIRERGGRAIAGLSMGGYGAVKFAFKYPNLFAFAGSLSGALDAAQNLDTLRPEFRAKLLEVFGKEGSPTRAENDVFRLLDAREDTAYPYLYLACGTGDFFLDTNRALVRQLSSRKIAYEYHETPGEHSWDYWDKALGPMLQAIERTVPEAAPRAQAR